MPTVACDFLLTAFDHGLYEPIVSTAALAEIERTLIEDFPHLDPAAIHHRVATMHVALEDQLVDGHAVDVPAGINPKDRHVVGAALVSAAQGSSRTTVASAARSTRPGSNWPPSTSTPLP